MVTYTFLSGKNLFTRKKDFSGEKVLTDKKVFIG